MTAEQRWVLDLKEVMALRLECTRCGTAVVYKPIEWRDSPTTCPGCGGFWDRPQVSSEPPSALQQLGTGLRQLIDLEGAVSRSGGELPYRLKIEIRDPMSSKYGLSTDT